MNFGEMAAWVISDIKRPEKTSQAKDFINAAIEHTCSIIDWDADIIEVTHPIDATQYAQSLDLTNVTYFTRFRKMAYIRPDTTTKYLDPVSPSKVFTPDGCERLNTYYRAGTKIVFKLKLLAANLLLGYYRYPGVLLNDTDVHWLLTERPSLIHDFVCGRLFTIIGDDTEGARYKRFYDEAIASVNRSYIAT